MYDTANLTETVTYNYDDKHCQLEYIMNTYDLLKSSVILCLLSISLLPSSQTLSSSMIHDAMHINTDVRILSQTR